MAIKDKSKMGNSHAEKASGIKITKSVNSVTATQTEMGRALGITRQRVSQLIQEGILPTDATNSPYLVKGIKQYCNMKGENGGDIDFDKERALHEKAKREIAELQLMKMKKQAYSARTVEYVMTEMLSNLRTQLLGLPSKLAPLLEGKTKEEIYTSMTKEIEEKLSELSSYSPDLFDEDVEEEDDDEDS